MITLLEEIGVKKNFYDQLKSGSKTVEGRKASKKYLNLRKDDLVVFFNQNDNSKSFMARIIDLRYYLYDKNLDNNPLDEFLSNESLEKLLPEVNDIQTAKKIYIDIYGSEDDIKKLGGMVAIEILSVE